VLSSVMSLNDLRSQCQGQRLATLSDDEDFELLCSRKGEASGWRKRWRWL